MEKKLIEEEAHEWCIRRKEEWTHDHPGDPVVMDSAYSKIDDTYIGGFEEKLPLWEKYGIIPQGAKPGVGVASIGFSVKEVKWYGWSHRALFGFGIGSEVKRGDVAYQAPNQWEYLRQCVDFWSEYEGARGYLGYVHGRGFGVVVEWTNPKGGIGGNFMPFPPKWGRGEWKAETLDDAKEMAIAFAEEIS